MRPLHRSPAALALVLLGGTLGTAAREALTLAVPPVAGLPAALLLANLAGALLLGVLLEALARRGPDLGTRRSLRLLLGTGALGGFTSYSALSLAVAQGLLGTGTELAGIAYGLGSVAAGALATVAGIALAARFGPAPEPPLDAGEGA
ncbi:CrcB family protein [Brachybacterium huguangmaarense]